MSLMKECGRKRDKSKKAGERVERAVLILMKNQTVSQEMSVVLVLIYHKRETCCSHNFWVSQRTLLADILHTCGRRMKMVVVTTAGQQKNFTMPLLQNWRRPKLHQSSLWPIGLTLKPWLILRTLIILIKKLAADLALGDILPAFLLCNI